MREHLEAILKFQGQSNAPLFTRNVAPMIIPVEYDIRAAQKALEKSRTEAQKNREQDALLDLFSVIPKVVNSQTTTAQLLLEKRCLKKRIVESAYTARVSKTDFYMPTYRTLKQSFAAAKQDPHHKCTNHRSLPKNSYYFHDSAPNVATGDVFVCVECGASHFCTQELCDTRELNQNNEGQVCRISGKYMGIITARPDAYKPYSYYIDAGQDTERNEYTEPLLGKRSKELGLVRKSEPRPKRTTFKNLSRESLNIIANNPKNATKLRKLTECIRTVVRNVMMPPNFYELCEVAIRELTEKGLRKTEDLIKSGTYLTSLDLMNVFTYYTREIVPVLTARNSQHLVTEEMVSYFSKCVLEIFKIVSNAPNDECVQGAKNMTITNTVISILYQIKEGISSTICITSVEAIQEFCEMDRFTIKFLKTASETCGFDPQDGHCSHKSIEFVTKHKILDFVLLPLEIINTTSATSYSSAYSQYQLQTPHQQHQQTRSRLFFDPSELNIKAGKNRLTSTTMRAIKAFISIISHDDGHRDEESLKKYILSNNMALDRNFVEGRLDNLFTQK